VAEVDALPQDLVFVDLETTGGNAAHHRITEVGIVRMTDGRVVEEWSTLVNPECRIPSYIEAFTGITNDMVARAPRFAEIAPAVLGKLRGAMPEPSAAPVFVAHNARFDYSFLRAEFRRADLPFAATVLCTVKLSRRLFPEYHRHSLDAILERHRLTCSARHRALGDARVLFDFWKVLRADVPVERLAHAANAVMGAQRLPDYLPAGLADELPDGPGVYRFFDADGTLLYIGRSHSLRTRVLGHFGSESSDAREQKKARLVRRIDWLETAGELGARLQEIEWHRAQKPVFNKRVANKGAGFTLRSRASGGGVQMLPIDELLPTELDGCFGMFQTEKDGRKAMADIARAHALCLRVLGFEAGEGSCLAFQLGRCKGACVGQEPRVLHDIRLQMALSSLKLKAWPYPGRVALQEGRSDYHVFDHWVYLGTARSEEELADFSARETAAHFDSEIYRIVTRYLEKNPDARWYPA
jgi:DNA polymerase-3 subunit epsilon